MKKVCKLFFTSALLLTSLSVLSLTPKQESSSNDFEVGEMNLNDHEVIRMNRAKGGVIKESTEPIKGTNGLPLDGGSFTNKGTSKRVSKVVAQKVETNGKTTIRFASAVKLDKVGRNDSDQLYMTKGGEFGFHIAYTREDKRVNYLFPASNFFVSIEAPTKSYVANEYSEHNADSSYGKMDDYVKEVLNENQGNVNGYNAFITMEVRNIPSTFVDYIEAQPYFYASEVEKRELAPFSKKADTTGLETYTIKTTTNGETKEEIMKNAKGTGGDERQYTSGVVEIGTKFSILDSYGSPITSWDGIQEATSEFTAKRKGSYSFYALYSKKVYHTEPALTYGVSINEGKVITLEDRDTQYYANLGKVSKGDVITFTNNEGVLGAGVNLHKYNNNMVKLTNKITVRKNNDNAELYIDKEGMKASLTGYTDVYGIKIGNRNIELTYDQGEDKYVLPAGTKITAKKDDVVVTKFNEDNGNIAPEDKAANKVGIDNKIKEDCIITGIYWYEPNGHLWINGEAQGETTFYYVKIGETKHEVVENPKNNKEYYLTTTKGIVAKKGEKLDTYYDDILDSDIATLQKDLLDENLCFLKDVMISAIYWEPGVHKIWIEYTDGINEHNYNVKYTGAGTLDKNAKYYAKAWNQSEWIADLYPCVVNDDNSVSFKTNYNYSKVSIQKLPSYYDEKVNTFDQFILTNTPALTPDNYNMSFSGWNLIGDEVTCTNNPDWLLNDGARVYAYLWGSPNNGGTEYREAYVDGTTVKFVAPRSKEHANFILTRRGYSTQKPRPEDNTEYNKTKDMTFTRNDNFDIVSPIDMNGKW